MLSLRRHALVGSGLVVLVSACASGGGRVDALPSYADIPAPTEAVVGGPRFSIYDTGARRVRLSSRS